jgi:uncharacterized protein YjbJ (UPF0337 family)
MSNKSKTIAKDAEGKLESAYGEITGDLGHQIKGQAKQEQAAAQDVLADLNEGAKVVKKKLRDAAQRTGDNL